jgi:hypothetical protein
MCHVPPGSAGFAYGLVLFGTTWLIAHWRCPFPSITFEPRGPGSFENRLVNYTKVAETVIGLASGSVIALVGSSVLRTNSHLPWYFASPLVLLGLTVSYSVLFIAFLTRFYEDFLHFPSSYTKFRYLLVQAFGFSALLCFPTAYVWLAFALGNN